jgi:hypothetical protein
MGLPGSDVGTTAGRELSRIHSLPETSPLRAEIAALIPVKMAASAVPVPGHSHNWGRDHGEQGD